MTFAEHIVDVLLEAEEAFPEDNLPTPEEITRSIGVGYSPDEFVFNWHQHRCMGYFTGSSNCYVSWKKFTRMGHPIFLGVINRVERDVRCPSLPVANEGQWYIESVPSYSRLRIPRGRKIKRGHEHKFTKTYYGYGAVRYREQPETYTRYFSSALEAAAYLASLINPDKRLRPAEDVHIETAEELA